MALLFFWSWLIFFVNFHSVLENLEVGVVLFLEFQSSSLPPGGGGGAEGSSDGR